MKRIFLFVILISSVAGFYFFRHNVFAQPQVVVDDGIRQRILNATVQIKLIAPLTDEAGDPVVAESNGSWHAQNQATHGIGTLVNAGNEVIIITHDHWGEMLKRAETVQFRNARGDMLAEIRGSAFRDLLLYKDQGTLLMAAPQELAPLFAQAVVRGDSRQIVNGSMVFMTRHQAGNSLVEVVAAQVTDVMTESGPVTYDLLSLDGTPIVKGDSGGGVWSEGELVGNIWWTVIKADVVTDASGAAAFTEMIAETLASGEPEQQFGPEAQLAP